MSAWKSWSTASDADGMTVLVKFKMSDGDIHIEDVTIDYNAYHDEVDYMLFDGETFNVNVKPIAWMEIPE